MTVLASRGGVVIRLLDDSHHDVALLARWLSDPRILEWYEGRDNPFDEARIRAEYAPAVQLAEGTIACVIEEGGSPAGYLQLVAIEGYGAEYGFDDDVDLSRTWGIDLFLEPERWGRGLGTATVQLAIDHLTVDRGADRIVIDPRVVNERAIRAYEKAGFEPWKVLAERELHEGRHWESLIMVLDPCDTVVGLTAALARISSINPGLVPGAPGEGQVADFVAAWFRHRGFEVRVDDVVPGRPNVVATIRGSGAGRSLLFNGHLDTVGVGGEATAEVRLGDGRILGRGVLDTKGGLAAAMVAAWRAATTRLAGDVIVAAVVDEEHASLGTDALVAADVRADAAIVLEPTDLAVVVAHRGFAVLDVELTGRAAHTSRPDRGINAAHAAARVTTAVDALAAMWAAGTGALLPSALVSSVNTEGETFTVPARCRMTVELRTTAPDPAAQVAEAVGGILSAAGEADAQVRVALERPPMALPADHELVAALRAALPASAVTTAPYWTDAALHVAVGTPAVVLGPIGEGLHEDLEWVSIDSLHRLTDALGALARAWCGAAAASDR